MTARSPRLKTVVTMLVLSAAFLLIYTRDLGRTPIYLYHDEVFFGVQAHSIATTGRDTHGRFLPVYFQVYSNLWFQPAIVYLTALVFKVLPVSEGALRMPTVLMGLCDVLLMYAIAKRLFQREWLAVVAACLLGLTPAHFTFGRLAIDCLYPVTFLLAWLLGLTVFFARVQPWVLFAATSCLGLGFYSYIAAVAMMPLYLALTCASLWLTFDRPWKLCLIAVAGFAWPVVLSVPFHVLHPEFLADQLARYAPRQPTRALDPMQQMRELVNYTNLSQRVTLYFNFFDPGYLFLSGSGNPLESTRQAGVFLMPVAVFLPVGIYQVIRRHRGAVSLIALFGFVTAPLAALIMSEGGATDREMELLPFGVLLATYGVEYLSAAPLDWPLRRLYAPVCALGAATGVTYAAWTLLREHRLGGSALPLVAASAAIYAVGRISDRTRRWTTVTAVLCLLGLWQFRAFYDDYLSDYRLRSAGRFEGNLRGALEEILVREDRDHPRPVFVSTSVHYAESHWYFYAARQRRNDLLTAMTDLDPATIRVDQLAPGSLVLTTVGDAADDALARQASLAVVARVLEPDNTPAFLLLEKKMP